MPVIFYPPLWGSQALSNLSFLIGSFHQHLNMFKFPILKTFFIIKLLQLPSFPSFIDESLEKTVYTLGRTSTSLARTPQSIALWLQSSAAFSRAHRGYD